MPTHVINKKMVARKACNLIRGVLISFCLEH
jgi:hypothetical protein